MHLSEFDNIQKLVMQNFWFSKLPMYSILVPNDQIVEPNIVSHLCIDSYMTISKLK